MEPADHLLRRESQDYGGGQVFAEMSGTYAIYLPESTKSGILNLSQEGGKLEKLWYNPRTGTFEGPASVVRGGRRVKLGKPPSDVGEDWVILMRRIKNNP